MPTLPRIVSVCLLFSATLTQLASAAPAADSPLSPADSLAAMELVDGFTVQLVAAEPQVIDPVAMRFDEQGRLWVVEMHDYPHGPTDGETPRSRIRMLTDSDNDGTFDTATTFADELLFATGIQPWQGGLFATVAGKVIYLKDTNNDGRADVNETWFTGFAEENSQLRANHPRLGVDGYIYVANGLRGGAVVGQRAGDPKVDLRGADFRFNPHTRDYEAVSGPGQFGLCFDQYGNRFVCSNRHPADHVVLGRSYQRQNPLAPAFAPLEEVAAAGEASRLFPISKAWTTSNLHANQFTAACGVLIHEATAFTCDPTGNLLHAELIAPLGPTFTAKPQFADREFLASRDTWFRPVNLEMGPDDALYVVDMYRAVIEHPQFMPAELKQRPDLMLGTDRGRIYRIVKQKSKQPRKLLVSVSDTTALIGLLAHENAWQRSTALRMLYQQGLNKQSTAELAKLLTPETPATAQIAALRLLSFHNALGEESLTQVLGYEAATSQQAEVMRHAIALAESKLATKEAWRERVVQLLAADSAVVQFQAALSLAAVEEFDRTALAPLYHDRPNNAWLHRALLISVGPHGSSLLNHLLATTPWTQENPLPTPSQLYVLAELTKMAGSDKKSDDLLRVLPALKHVPRDARYLPVRLVIATEAAAALHRRGESLSFLKRHANAAIREAVVDTLADAARVATDREAPEQLRVGAIELVAYDLDAAGLVQKLALAEGSPTIRAAAISALANQEPIEPWEQLLNHFPQYSPPIRVAILDGVLRNLKRTELLLAAVEAGVISLGEIDPLRMRKLQSHADPKIRARTKQLLDELYPEDRKVAIAAHRQALELAGDPLAGREVFRKNCAACHRIGDLGQQIGPDISDSRVKTPAQILTDILQPNLAIDANFIGYTVQTTDGKVFSGLIEAATDDQVTLRIPEKNSTLSLSRESIEQMISTGASLMPEGFEKNVSIQEMADLIAFIKNWRYLDGSVPADGLGK